MDLLLGTFASKFVMGMSSAELVEYEAILNHETLDIFNYITNRGDIPQVRMRWRAVAAEGAPARCPAVNRDRNRNRDRSRDRSRHCTRGGGGECPC